VCRTEKINKTVEKLRELNEKRDKLFDKLTASLAIQQLWPEAFKLGRVHSNFQSIGGLQRDIRGRVKIPPKKRRFKFVVTRKDGETREFFYEDLPEVLQLRAIRFLKVSMWVEV
jgi:hypothetical protein